MKKDDKQPQIVACTSFFKNNTKDQYPLPLPAMVSMGCQVVFISWQSMMR
jgi:hypothetical protein